MSNPARFKAAFAVFAAGLAAFSAWDYWEHRDLMRTITAREESNQARLAELATQLANARKEIDAQPEIERQTAAARAELRFRSGKVPTGSAKVWFPVWFKEQLQAIGIAESQIRLNVEFPELGRSGFKRTFWNVSLPAQVGMKSIPTVLVALEEIENRERLVKILDCNFQPGPDGPQSPTGAFNVEAIVED